MSPNYIQKSIKLYYLCNKTVINPVSDVNLNKNFQGEKDSGLAIKNYRTVCRYIF